MYSIVTLADVVQIHPTDFTKPSYRAIEDWINNKYADKVIHKIGLCVGFHSLISASEGLIGHGTGIVNVNVDFKMVVFRPSKGEIIPGTITHANLKGIYLSMDFFEDIQAPAELLFPGTSWDKDEAGAELYVWRTNDGAGGVNEFFFDLQEKCMMRVEGELWNDLSPQMKRPNDDDEKDDETTVQLAPYKILASMMHTGLGPTQWWAGDEAADATEAVQDEEMSG